jgi:hypothetical protein
MWRWTHGGPPRRRRPGPRARGETAGRPAAWVPLVAVLELLPGVLDSQLRRDAALTHFEYYVLAMLSEAPGGPCG